MRYEGKTYSVYHCLKRANEHKKINHKVNTSSHHKSKTQTTKTKPISDIFFFLPTFKTIS